MNVAGQMHFHAARQIEASFDRCAYHCKVVQSDHESPSRHWHLNVFKISMGWIGSACQRSKWGSKWDVKVGFQSRTDDRFMSSVTQPALDHRHRSLASTKPAFTGLFSTYSIKY